jgi:hypothetical protein
LSEKKLYERLALIFLFILLPSLLAVSCQEPLFKAEKSDVINKIIICTGEDCKTEIECNDDDENCE